MSFPISNAHSNLDRLSLRPTEYTECQAFCPVVRIGSPTPSPQVSVAAPPGPGGEGLGGPNSYEGTDTLVLYICTYSIIPLRLRLFVFTANRLCVNEDQSLFATVVTSSTPPPPHLKKLVCYTYFCSLFFLLLYVLLEALSY